MLRAFRPEASRVQRLICRQPTAITDFSCGPGAPPRAGRAQLAYFAYLSLFGFDPLMEKNSM